MRVQRILRTTTVVWDKIFICIRNICIYRTEWKIIWVLGDKMGVKAGTASQVKTWWSVQDFHHMVKTLNNCYKCNTGGHIRRDCPGQPRWTYGNEKFNYMVNPLGHCWECNQPGHVRMKCPDLVQSGTSYRTRTSVACYQRDREKNKDLRNSRMMLRGYSGRRWRKITGSWRILQQRRQRRKDSFPKYWCWEDILEGDDGKQHEARDFCSREDKGGTIYFLKYRCCSK